MKVLLRIALGVAAVVCMFLGTMTASAQGLSASYVAQATCDNGMVAPGTYGFLTVKGVCSVPSGTVTVHQLWIAPNSALLASSDAATFNVVGNATVASGGVFVLGCLESGCSSTHDSITGNLVANGALAVIFHHNTITGNVSMQGGGGGVNCAPQALLQGSPAFSDFEDNTINGNVLVSGLRSCWFGFIRNHVTGITYLANNQFFLTDAMEIVSNTVRGQLICLNNTPPAHVGDSRGSPNMVTGLALGECKAVSTQA